MANTIQENNIQQTLKKVYSILNFKEEEAEAAVKGLAGIQQMALLTELIKVLTDDEVNTINNLGEASDVEKRAVMDKIVKAHEGDAVFRAKAKEATKGVIKKYIAYLQTRGDDSQKAQISQALAGLV